MIFQNKDRSKAAVLGSVAHRDPNTGKWAANAAVLSSTGNGWRVDGTANILFIRKQGATQHIITQVYTDFDTKRPYVLALTLPSLAYDKDFNFHSTQSGPVWTLSIDGTGAFDFATTIAAKQGSKTYTFPVASSEPLTTVASGALSGGAHIGLTRAVMIPKAGKPTPCSAWTYAGGNASFTCDDSKFAPEQFPYKLDPSSQTLTDGGTYNVDAWQAVIGGHWDYGFDTADVNFNTSGILPAGAYYLGSSCGFNTLSQDGPDPLGCSPSPYNPSTMSATVSFDTSSDCETCDYNDSATVNNVTLTLNWYDPPYNVSPANGATNQSTTATTLTWGGPATSTCPAGPGWNIPDYTYTLYLNGAQVASGLSVPDNGGGFGTASYTVSGLNPGTQYSWQVSATYPTYNVSGLCSLGMPSLYSNAWTFSTALSPSQAPTFNPLPGTYTAAQSVTLSTTAPGATIRYTLDGSTPSETVGAIYTGPIGLTTTTTIKAIAYVNGADSPVSTGPYTIAIPDPRRTGVRTTGSYWGATGENIDLNSGNLNLSVPLLQAKSRGNWSATFALSYNSQFWRGTSSGPVKLAGDVGYGLGWILQLGSVLPSGGYYVFTDSTGAQYRLDQANGNIWTSREGVYASFDANFNRLYFPDGTFWIMVRNRSRPKPTPARSTPPTSRIPTGTI